MWGSHRAVVRASEQRAPPSGCPGLAPGSVAPLGWSSLVRYEAVVSRPWGVLRGWMRASWKTVAADGCAWPLIFVALGFL